MPSRLEQQKQNLEKLFEGLSPDQQSEVKRYQKASKVDRAKMLPKMSVAALAYLNSKEPAQRVVPTQFVSPQELTNQKGRNEKSISPGNGNEKLIIGGLVGISGIAFLALALYVSDQSDKLQKTIIERDHQIATLGFEATRGVLPTATTMPAQTLIPPTSVSTEKPTTAQATAVPTLEPTKQEILTDEKAVWPGELPHTHFWRVETDPDQVSKKIIQYEIDNAGNLDNLDSLRTSWFNKPSSFKPLVTRFTPGLPKNELGFGITVADLKNARSAKEIFADAKEIKLGDILQKNSNDIYAVLTYASANDRDAMSLYISAGLLAKRHSDLADMSFDEFLEKLKKDEIKEANELAQIQAALLNQTQDSYLGTSVNEKNRREDQASGDLSGLIPEKFRKPDRFSSCDVRRPAANERKNQPQSILDRVNHVDNGKDTRNEANNEGEGTILILSTDSVGNKFIVGQFTNRKVITPEKEYKDNPLNPDAARGAQEFPCAKSQPVIARTVIPGIKPEVTPNMPEKTPPPPRSTPTPPNEPTSTPMPTNADPPQNLPTATPGAPRPTDIP